MSNCAIILAGGEGKRMKSDKPKRVVKPPQTVLDFVLLKDKTIMVTIGMYKKSRMSAR